MRTVEWPCNQSNHNKTGIRELSSEMLARCFGTLILVTFFYDPERSMSKMKQNKVIKHVLLDDLYFYSMFLEYLDTLGSD